MSSTYSGIVCCYQIQAVSVNIIGRSRRLWCTDVISVVQDNSTMAAVGRRRRISNSRRVMSVCVCVAVATGFKPSARQCYQHASCRRLGSVSVNVWTLSSAFLLFLDKNYISVLCRSMVFYRLSEPSQFYLQHCNNALYCVINGMLIALLCVCRSVIMINLYTASADKLSLTYSK